MEAGIGSRSRATVVALLAALLTGALLLATAQAAEARPQLLAPGNGKVLEKGSRPTFKLRDTSSNARRYSIFMTVATKKQTNGAGELKRTRIGTFAKMNPRGRVGFAYTPPSYSFPDWFMQRPGTYYWQAFHIDCSIPSRFRCHVTSSIRSFKVA